MPAGSYMTAAWAIRPAMVDHSRRGAFKLAGGGVLAGLLAPFALKTPKVGAVPAFALGPTTRDMKHNLDKINELTSAMSRHNALQKVLNALYDRRHKAKIIPLDHDIAGLKSVKPWAQNMMQVARNKDQDDLIAKVRKLIGNDDGDSAIDINNDLLPY